MLKLTHIFSEFKLNIKFFNKRLLKPALSIWAILLLTTSCAFFKPHKPLISDDTRYWLSSDTVFIFPKAPLPVPAGDTVDTALLGFIQFLEEAGLVNIHDIDSSIVVDLRYATTDNFMHTNMYHTFKEAYLQYDVALRLKNAQHFLKNIHPHYSLVIYDAVRPAEVQQFMWDSVKINEAVKYKYLSNPKYHSLHNYGAAVDVSILDSNGLPLDMGTPFDCFCELAYPYYEKRFLATHQLTRKQYQNRLLLRRIMRQALFSPITTEWWHFNAHSRKYAKAHYPLIKSFSQRPSAPVAAFSIPKNPTHKSLSASLPRRIPPVDYSTAVSNSFHMPQPVLSARSELSPIIDSLHHCIEFRIQIKLSSKPLPANCRCFKGLAINTYFHHGLYKYTTGHFRSLKESLVARKRIQQMGFADCFVVAFDNNKRIPIKDAISLLEE